MTQEEWLAKMPDSADGSQVARWLSAGLRLWGDDADALGNAIKGAAHRALYEKPILAERLARALVALGEHVEEERLVALGEMALGDGYRLRGRVAEGLALLDQAATRFLEAGDEVGWARTRIGWLGHVHTRVDRPPLDPIAERAATIFERHEGWHWLIVLCTNYAYYGYIVGRPDHQLLWCERAQGALAHLQGPDERFYAEAQILGLRLDAYNDLGEYERAQAVSEEMERLFEGREHIERLYVEWLLRAARLHLNTGRYAQTLDYLYRARPIAHDGGFPILAAQVELYLAMSYSALNRLDEAEPIMRDLLAFQSEHGGELEIEMRVKLVDLLLARERWYEAATILQPVIEEMEAQPEKRAVWLSDAYRQQARALAKLGEEGASAALAQSIRWAHACQGRWSLAHSFLLMAEIGPQAERRGALAEALALSKGIPWMRWRVNHLAARQSPSPPARRAALARAADDLDQVQSTLGASFHADYLSASKALYDELIATCLEAGDVAQAWQTLERAKSRALTNSMLYQTEGANRADTPLAHELERLRLRHYTLLRKLDEGGGSWDDLHAVERAIAGVQEAIEVATLGRREPLSVPEAFVPHAPRGRDLVGYYLVGEEVHGFLHDGQRYHHLRLPTTPEELNSYLTAVFVNMRTTPHASDRWLPALSTQLSGALEALDAVLLAPLRPLRQHEALTVVPHGLLHQLPFHLLRHGGRYLLEQGTTQVVPTARLLHDSRPAAPHGRNIVIAHSWGGRLPQTRAEGQRVAALLGGAQVIEEEAVTRARVRAALQDAAVLHIATHGEHRSDAPHFSFLQLEDGQLCVGDLFHLSLPASLVTLSACDSGQMVIRAGDDPVGLARGFLAAGARSLLVALWQLDDTCTPQLMEHFYQHVMAGIPKGEALRLVQQQWLAEAEGRLRHPFYWGALQLIGDDGKLEIRY